jgi:hypothetical protein
MEVFTLSQQTKSLHRTATAVTRRRTLRFDLRGWSAMSFGEFVGG